jgi:hypothetical protein
MVEPGKRGFTGKMLLTKHPERRCKAHKKNGERCGHASLVGQAVCRFHGGAAKQCVNAARVRLQNAAEKMARELLGMATDTTVPEGVRLAAIKDALDRAGLKPATIVDLEVSPKPFELVFDSITAGPRTPTPPEIESGATESGESDEPDVVIGEIDEDPLPEDDEIEPDANEAEVIDVEIEAIEDSGYTDAIMSDQPVPITSMVAGRLLSAPLPGVYETLPRQQPNSGFPAITEPLVDHDHFSRRNL